MNVRKNFFITLSVVTVAMLTSSMAGTRLQGSDQPGNVRNIRYAGVNVVRVMDQGEWETYRAEWYDSTKMEQYMASIGEHFNAVRICVGSKHFVDPDNVIDEEAYKNNLIHTLKQCKRNRIWVVFGVWPNEIGINRSVNPHFDPYFDMSGREIHKQGLRILAQLIKDNGFLQNTLYIDCRNEINGHLGACYTAGLGWGDVSDTAAPSFRAWIKDKYVTLDSLNKAWGKKYLSFDEIQLFHSNPPAKARQDQQDWLLWCFRDWVSIMKAEIKAADPAIRVGQSTTGDHGRSSIEGYDNTNSLYRQLEIGDLVDVLDFHIYGPPYGPEVSPAAMLALLKERWPQKLLICGESRNDLNDVDCINLAGAHGLLFWDEGQLTKYGKWQPSPEGVAFLEELERYKAYVYPPRPFRGDVNENGTLDIFDLLALFKVLSGVADVTPASDINDDGKTDISDLFEFIGILAGRES
ncbi:MAG TPA: beta-galactosidase [archaeon]|nr:beta-galactosidase [archaeon]